MYPAYTLHNAPIGIGPLAEYLPQWLEQQDFSGIMVLCDEHTARFCLPVLDPLLPTNTHKVIIPAGESFKTLDTCQTLWQAMLDARLDRKALLLNLGGGVVGDLGGFCAATWKRGIAFAQIPTTLLSMTDAAIGGKTGIDFQHVKNVIGAFQQPAAVFVDPVFLQTLPESERRSGMAEVLKHALIGDPELLEMLKAPGAPDWQQLLYRSIGVKVKVVQEDPLEKGLRMLLNYGHTIGHGMETYFLHHPWPLSHGHAVYIGMLCESHALGNEYGASLIRHLLDIGQKLFPCFDIPESALPGIWEHMQQDKKNLSGKVRMTLPDKQPYSLHLAELTYNQLISSLHFYQSLK